MTKLSILKNCIYKSNNISDFTKLLIGNDFNIIYNNNTLLVYDPELYPFKSYIFDNNLNIILKYNEKHSSNIPDSLNNKFNWNMVNIYKYYESDNIILLYNNDKWNIISNKNINSTENCNLFNNNDKLNFNLLDKEYCYFFEMLNHNDNNKIIKYSEKLNYPHIYHIKTIKKYTLENININIKEIIKKPKEQFKSLRHLLNITDLINTRSFEDKTITLKGYIIYYDNNYYKIKLTLYNELKNMINFEYDNQYLKYLELYKNNNLTYYLQFVDNNPQKIINLINNSIKNLSKELTNLYFLTRFKNNPDIYHNLTNTYKKVIFDIHGIYINNKKNDSNNKLNINNQIVHNYLKTLPIQELIMILYDRKNNINSLFYSESVEIDNLLNLIDS